MCMKIAAARWKLACLARCMQVATIPPSPGGPAPQSAAAASTSPGPIATFVSLLSLLLGTTTAAAPPAQDSRTAAADAPASAGSDSKGGVQQTESQGGRLRERAVRNSVLIGHFPLPGGSPAAVPSGSPGAPKQSNATESSARRPCNRDQEKSDADSEQATTAPAAQVAIGVMPPVPGLAAPANMAPAPLPERSGSSCNAAGPLDQALVDATPVFVPTPSDSRLAKTPEPPVAFVLELKPAAQGLAAPTQPVPAAKGADRDMALEADALLSTGARASAPLVKSDAQTGNQQKNLTEGERDRRAALEPMRPRREESVAPSGDLKSIETILKPGVVTPGSGNPRPPMQGEAFAEAVSTAEPAARAGAVAAPEQPKPAAVREISFQSASPEAGSVKVQLIDRGGDVHISVRSSDPNFTHALQRDVGQLVTKLDRAGYETKVWNPRDVSPLTAATGVRDIEIRADAGGGSSASPDPGSQGGQGGGQEHAQQQRRHGDPRQWADALNETARRAITDDEEDLWQ